MAAPYGEGKPLKTSAPSFEMYILESLWCAEKNEFTKRKKEEEKQEHVFISRKLN